MLNRKKNRGEKIRCCVNVILQLTYSPGVHNAFIRSIVIENGTCSVSLRRFSTLCVHMSFIRVCIRVCNATKIIMHQFSVNSSCVWMRNYTKLPNNKLNNTVTALILCSKFDWIDLFKKIRKQFFYSSWVFTGKVVV